MQIINQMLRNTKRCNKKRDNPEKPEIQGKQDEEKKQNKNTTPYANKIYVLPQTTGGKDEPNIVPIH